MQINPCKKNMDKKINKSENTSPPPGQMSKSKTPHDCIYKLHEKNHMVQKHMFHDVFGLTVFGFQLCFQLG